MRAPGAAGGMEAACAIRLTELDLSAAPLKHAQSHLYYIYCQSNCHRPHAFTLRHRLSVGRASETLRTSSDPRLRTQGWYQQHSCQQPWNYAAHSCP